MNENKTQQTQTNIQANNQSNQKAQQAAKAAEAKMVINGKEVDVKTAQAAEEAFNRQNTQTGIQAHHDNSSEAVEAGQVAQNAGSFTASQNKAAVKAANIQSGQQHLEAHLGSAQQQSGSQFQQAQQDHEAMQNALDAKAKAKTKKAD